MNLHTLKELETQLQALEAENNRLLEAYQKEKETTQWMHDLIWELINQSAEESPSEIAKLKETIKWMHDLIWELILANGK